MKLNTVEELKNFSALLDRCGGHVYMLTPEGETIELTDKSVRLRGLAYLAGDRAEMYRIFARRREDEALLMDYICHQKLSA